MNIDITYKSIIRVVVVLTLLLILYQVIDVIVVIFLGIIISSTVTPVVNTLKKKGIPRVVASSIIYIIISSIFITVIYVVLPPTILEISKLSVQLPSLLSNSLGYLSLPQNFFEGIRENLSQASSNALGWLVGLLGGMENILFVIFISFYLTVENEGIKRFLEAGLPDHSSSHIIELISRSQNTLAQWLKAQLLLMFLVGLTTSLALFIIGVPNALALGVFAGILEIIPFFGPAISAIPAVLIASSISGVTALVTLAVFIAIQQFESQLLTPQIMKRTFEINPVLALIALFIGSKLGGIGGTLVSIPLLALAMEFYKNYERKV